jgi:hypothetical protein
MLPESRSPQEPDRADGPYQKMAYSISEVVKLTSLGRTAVFAEIKAGRLVARKQGRRTLILVADLAAWLRALPAVDRSSR